MDFKIVKTKRDVDISREIVYKAYLRKGITDPVEEKRITHSNYASNNSVTVIGYKEGVPTITSSCVFDTLEHGLPLDEYFPEELEIMRALGGGIIESGLFGDIRPVSNFREVLTIQAIVFNAVRQNRCRYLVGGLNPNSERFYVQHFGIYAPEQEIMKHKRFNDKPVFLMMKDTVKSPWDSNLLGVKMMDRVNRTHDCTIASCELLNFINQHTRKYYV